MLHIILNRETSKRSIIRWLMHIFILFGFAIMFLHFAPRLLLVGLFPAIESKAWYLSTHNIVAILFISGVTIALSRRIIVSKIRNVTTVTDLLPLALILSIFLTGYLLKSVELENIRLYDAAYLAHYIVTYTTIAYLPFSKLLHIIAVPILAFINRYREILHGRVENFEPLTGETFSDPQLSPADLTALQRVELDACTCCGECLNWCAAYDATLENTITPLQKIAKYKSFVKKLFSLKPVSWEETEKFLRDMMRDFYKCTACGQCEKICPAHINTVNLWEAIRAQLVKAGYGPMPIHKGFASRIYTLGNAYGEEYERTKWFKDLKSSRD